MEIVEKLRGVAAFGRRSPQLWYYKMVHIWPVMLAAQGLYIAYVQLYMASMLAMYGHL